MPEYRWCRLGVTRVTRAPSIGAPTRLRSTNACAWPPPSNSSCFTRVSPRLGPGGQFRFLAPAQLLALHLAGGGHRQRLDELDFARVFVRREPPAHVPLNVILQRGRGLLPGLQHDRSEE